MKKLIVAIALMLGLASCDELIAVSEPPMPEQPTVMIPDTIIVNEPEVQVDTVWVNPGTPISFNVNVQDYNEQDMAV